MVTVDMSTARTQITKRQRRMRRAAQRRLQKQRKAQLRELHAAEAAQQARQRAISAWNAEEERLQQLRKKELNLPTGKNHNGPTPREKPRAVKFAEQVLVTEIPVRDADKLPEPFPSPLGVSICGTDDDSDYDNDDQSSQNNGASPCVTFSQLSEGAFPDDDDEDDPEFAPDDPLALKPPAHRIQRPRRRIAVKRLDVPLDQIIPARRTNKSKVAHAPKRPRPESQQFEPSSSSHVPPPLSINHRWEPRSPQANGDRPLKETSLQHKQSNDQRSSNGSSPYVRPKNKQKRVQSAGSDVPDENKQQTFDVKSKSRNKTDGRGTQLDESVSDQRGKSAKTRSMTRNQVETRSFTDNRASKTSASANPAEKNLSSLQNGQAKSAVKNTKGTSTPVANGHSRQNRCKPNGLHKDKLAVKRQDKPSDTSEDKDLDSIFGELVKQKAAIRVYKENISLQGKRAWEENCDEQPDFRRSKKRFKKGPTRYTDGGLRIMSYAEIAADQPPGLNGDCPFDCSCCF